MSNIVIKDLTGFETLGTQSMARIQGGTSYPVEPDGGIGGPGLSPMPELYLQADIAKLREEMSARVGTVPSIAEFIPGVDPLWGPY